MSKAASSDQRCGPVLVVDGDSTARRETTELISSLGYTVITAVDGAEAFDRVAETTVSAIVTEIALPGMDGFEFLEALMDRGSLIPVILLSSSSDVSDRAVSAIHDLRAFWYLRKPPELADFAPVLRHAVERSTLLYGSGWPDTNGRQSKGLGDLVGRSPAMQHLYRLVRRIAPTSAAVLITGESGTGKEVVARTIHALSDRNKRTFLPVNCAALPEDLIESELFGHEAGAFTGAASRHAGCFEQADGGTLFLDEIGEMPMTMQARLLRALEERKIRRLGGDAEHPVDVRILAATNRRPEEAVETKTLRADLYYRLNVLRVHMAPLRERKADIPLLVGSIVGELNHRHDCTIIGLHPKALALLMDYSWPGNIRELRNVLECAAIIARTGEILPQHLPRNIAPAENGSSRAGDRCAARAGSGCVLPVSEHAVQEAAQLLGVSSEALWVFLSGGGTTAARGAGADLERAWLRQRQPAF